MSEQNSLAPVAGVTPARFIPPLPPGIPILPGQLTAAKKKLRVPAGLIIVAVIAGLIGLMWLKVWYHDYDSNRIDPAVTRAVLAHAVKGTRIPVTLWSGPRLIEIESAFPQVQPGQAPATTVLSYVIDPKTGAKDPNYPWGVDTAIEGVAIRIR